MKDWTGNTTSVFKTLGASNHADCERQSEDYYATDPFAAQLLLQVETFSDHVWECACGEKHLSKVFETDGYQVRSSDLVDRCGNEVYDFLSEENTLWDGDIITNPPYKFATQFVQKAVDIIPNGRKVAMFLKLQFLEGKERRKLFEKYPPPHGICVQLAHPMRSKRKVRGAAQGWQRGGLRLVCMGERLQRKYNHKMD